MKLAMYGATAAAAVLLACAIIAVSFNSFPAASTELLQSEGMTAKEAKAEMLASAAQERLAQKDARIYQSLAAVAKKKVVAGAEDVKEFQKARNTQIQLDNRLSQLMQRFEAQKEALEYMAPRTREREVETNELNSEVQQLKQKLPKLSTDMKTLEQAIKKTKDEEKPTKREMRISQEILDKTGNAYQLFGQRAETSRQKAELSRQKVAELNYGALMAQREAGALRGKAQQASDAKQAKLLLQDAKTADSKVEMLNREADEALQSAQLFDAEAAEADSYKTMFGADAGQAQQRLAMANKKMAYIGQQLQRGKMLEQQAEQRQAFMAHALQSAESQLGASYADAREDASALKTGEHSTLATKRALEAARSQGIANTEKAMKDLSGMTKNKQAWAEDAEQAMSVEAQVRDHAAAALHFKDAAQAADSEEQVDQGEATQTQPQDASA